MQDHQFCMACGIRNEVDSIYCMNCGTKLHGVTGQTVSAGVTSKKCVNCGTCNQKNSTFCMECGFRLESPASDAETVSASQQMGVSDVASHSEPIASSGKTVVDVESAKFIRDQSNTSTDSKKDEEFVPAPSESPDFVLDHFEREDVRLIYATLAGIGRMAGKLNHQLDGLRDQVKRMKFYRKVMVACLILSIICVCGLLVIPRLVPMGWIIPVIATCGIVFVISFSVGITLFIKVLSRMKPSAPQDVYTIVELEEAVHKLRNMALTLLPLIPSNTRSLSAAENIADALSKTDEAPASIIAAQSNIKRGYPFTCRQSQLRSNDKDIEHWKHTTMHISESFEEFRANFQLNAESPQRVRTKRHLCIFAGFSIALDLVLIVAVIATVVIFPLKQSVSSEINSNNAQEQITYPPYPGGISKAEYDSFVADMTTETEIQSMHTGMWQIADCVTIGISTTGNAALPNQPAGIRADQSDDFTHWIPNPSDGGYCVTRGYLSDSGNVAVQAFDTFIPLNRDEIDLEAAQKPNMIIEKYQNAVGEDFQGVGVGTESDSAITSIPASDIVTHINQGDYSDIAGMYCRHNGACLDISQDGVMELVDENGVGIVPTNYDSMYPFSPYLQHLSIHDVDTEDGYLVHIPMTADSAWSCAPGSVTSINSCSASDGSYVFLNVVMYYAPPNTDLNQCSAISLDGTIPDTSRAFLIFQLDAGTNAPFSATDGEVFYRV